MKEKHNVILKEITDELALSLVSGGNGGGSTSSTSSTGSTGSTTGGSGDWATGVQTIWSTAIEVIAGKSCSWPGGFYGTGNPAPTGSGTCVGGPIGGSRG